MNKKLLTTQILLALAAAAMLPAGQAGAANPIDLAEHSGITVNEIELEDGNKALKIDTNRIITAADTYNKTPLNQYEALDITYTPQGNAGENRAFGVWSARYDFSNTDISINVQDNGTNNNDAMHLDNHFSSFTVNNFTAHVNAISSDIFNIGRNCTTDSTVTVLGNLTGEVENGHGIRANSALSINETDTAECKASITVKGATNISLNKDADTSFDAVGGEENAVLTPTAVWAGTDAKQGENVKGKGVIHLIGDTTINLNGAGNRGLWAGKNGLITAGNIRIYSHKKDEEGLTDSYGVAATNGNITYGSAGETSQNKYGSVVKINGDATIHMIDGEAAIYSLYGNNEVDEFLSETTKDVKVDADIGVMDIEGAIYAEYGGEIDIVAKTGNLVGDIMAYETGSDFKYEYVDIGGGVMVPIPAQQTNIKNAMVNFEGNNVRINGDALAGNSGIINLTLGAGSI